MKARTRSLAISASVIGLAGLAGWRMAQPGRPSEVPDTQRTKAQTAQVAPPQLPAPKVEPLPPAKPAEDQAPGKPAGPLARFMQNLDLLKLNTAQLQTYLTQNQRNAESLLAAYRLSGDLALLREAAAKFPEDAAVQLEVAFRSGDQAERRRAIDAVRRSDPENALGDYLSALDHFRAGNTEQAFADLASGAAKRRMDDFSLQAQQAAEEAYMAAGFSPLEAKAAAMTSLQRQQIKPLQDLSKQVSALYKAYSASGDTASADSLRQMGRALGTQIQESAPYFIDELVGLSIEKQYLHPTTDAARLAEMKQRTDRIREIATSQAFLAMDGPEAMAFFDRLKIYGEENAYRWLLTRHGTP